MSEGDHESWDDDMMMPESNETPMPMVSYYYIIGRIFVMVQELKSVYQWYIELSFQFYINT